MSLKGHLNSSGFPLQIAIRNLVDSTTNQHSWKTRFTEHSWSGEDGSGFIDLVLERNGVEHLNVECKRVQDSSWIFIVESSRLNEVSQVKSFVTESTGSEIRRFQWTDFDVGPITHESQFCVIPGNDGRSKSLIERVTAEIVLSTEALARETIQLCPENRHLTKIYYNILITTAKIQVCSINPNQISIPNGTVDNPIFNEVPYLRFRKQLIPTFNVQDKYPDYENYEIAKAKESTVFVVNSDCFLDFLSNFKWLETRRNHLASR